MKLVRIPDGEKAPIHFNVDNFDAVRRSENKTYIWINGERNPWLIDCPINTVLELINQK